MAACALHAPEIRNIHRVYQRSGFTPLVVPVDGVRIAVRMRRIKEYRVGYVGDRSDGHPLVIPHFGVYPDRASAQQFIDLYLT